MLLVAALSDFAPALLGAIVGAAAGGYATYRVELQRQQHERRLEERRREHETTILRRAEVREARAAARQASAQLRRSAVATKAVSGLKIWPKVDAQMFRPINDQDRSLLARELSHEDWRTVAEAEGSQAIATLSWGAGVGKSIDEDERTAMRGYAEDLRAAMRVLEAFAIDKLEPPDPRR